MCRLGYLLTITALLLLLAGCAEAPPAFDDISSTQSIDLADSTNTEGLENIFFDLHSWILGEISRLEGSSSQDTTLLEIKSIVIIAEEVYLQGNIMLAIRLLTEAELLLR